MSGGAETALGARVPVLTFLTNFLIGGTERQVVNLVRNYDRERYDVHLACFRRSGPLLREIDAKTVAFSDYPITTLPSSRTLWQQMQLSRYVRAHDIRIVHSFGFYANVFAVPAARFAGAKVVVASIRDTGDHLTRMQRALQKAACRLADHVLVNAQAVSDVLVKEGYDGSRISVIRNGLDASRFEKAAHRKSVRQEFGLPDASPVVAVFARLNPLKGIEYFLEAVSFLSRHFPEVRFLIVGDSMSQAYRQGLEALSDSLGLSACVTFSGFRGDVPEILTQVSVSVLPSLSEGLSNVVLEAMAAGVPIVATDVGGTSEMVEDGVTGVLVPPRNAVALAHAIASLLADPVRRHAMGEAGRLRVSERFSLQAAVSDTEKLYEGLLSKGRGPAVIPKSPRREAKERVAPRQQPVVTRNSDVSRAP
jgi:glycosyltransferase involved in cell wall biosynthesis